MTRRRVSEEEKVLFRKAVDHTRPQVVAPVKARKSIKPAKPGLDGHTGARLKRGAQAPEARLDLHGMTQDKAHGALMGFLTKAQKKGLRLTLVVTGKGNPENDGAEWTTRSHGVLKEMVPRWLHQADFAALVSGTAPAHIRHGGDGALYVYLRKSR